MRDFVKLSPAFWTSKAGKSLRKAGMAAQLLALYLVANPHGNWIGVYSLPLAYITIDTGLDAATVTAGLAACEAAGFAKYDHEAEVVWVLDAARDQIGEELKAADKRVGAVQKEFEAIPDDCVFIADFFKRYGEAFKLKARADMSVVEDDYVPFDVAGAAAVAVPARAGALDDVDLSPAAVLADDLPTTRDEVAGFIELVPEAPAREITPPPAEVANLECVRQFLLAREVSDLPMDAASLAPVYDAAQLVLATEGGEMLDRVLRMAVRSEDYALEDADVFLSFIKKHNTDQPLVA